MTTPAQEALQQQTEFISGMAGRLQTARSKLLRGGQWVSSRHDERGRLRDAMARAGIYERDLLQQLPCNPRVAVHGFERRWLLWRKRTGVAVASTLAPLEHYVSRPDAVAPPIGLAALREHVRQLIGDPRVPHVVGVCAPSGFTEEARETPLGLPNTKVVWIEPDGHGGWRVGSGEDDIPAELLEVFDPEDHAQKIDRVQRMLEERRVELLTGSLSAQALARELELPRSVVEAAFAESAEAKPEWRVSRQGDDWLLYRGAAGPAQEKKSMGVFDRIKALFQREGNETEKINALTERRAALAQQRDRLYEDIAQLEGKEAGLLAQGKAATSEIPRRRIATQLAQLRKDIARQHTALSMLNKQINIISTNVHNLSLIQQGERAELPSSEELTDNAVKAEEMLETLTADAELVSSLETDMHEASLTDDELAILKEFDEPAEAKAAPAEPAAPDAASAAPDAQRTDAPPARSEPAAPTEPVDRKRNEPESL